MAFPKTTVRGHNNSTAASTLPVNPADAITEIAVETRASRPARLVWSTHRPRLASNQTVASATRSTTCNLRIAIATQYQRQRQRHCHFCLLTCPPAAYSWQPLPSLEPPTYIILKRIGWNKHQKTRDLIQTRRQNQTEIAGHPNHLPTGTAANRKGTALP